MPKRVNKADLIKLIHTGKSKLQLFDNGTDECEWRQILAHCGATKRDENGKLSAKKMTVAQLQGVLRELQSRGFNLTTNTRRKATQHDNTALIAQIEALWGLMCDYGIFNSRKKTSCAKWLKSVSKVDALEFAEKDRLLKCVEALKQRAEQVGLTVKKDKQGNCFLEPPEDSA